MREAKIIKHLRNALNNPPIDLLEELKLAEVNKMASHDSITEQFPQSSPSTYTSSETKKGFNWVNYLAMAASFLLIVVGGNYFYQNTTVGELYLDINPSFSIEVKRNDLVKEIRPINYEAYDVLGDLDYDDKNYEEVIIELVEQVKLKGYLVEDLNVLLVSSKEKDSENKLSKIASQDIVNHFKGKPESVIVLRQDINDGENVISGLEMLLLKIAERENISDPSVLYNLTLQELINYLYSSDVNLEDYVEVLSSDDSSIDELIEQPEVEPEPVVEPTPPPAPTPQPEPAPAPPSISTPAPVYDDDDDDDDWDDDDDDWDDDDDD